MPKQIYTGRWAKTYRGRVGAVLALDRQTDRQTAGHTRDRCSAFSFVDAVSVMLSNAASPKRLNDSRKSHFITALAMLCAVYAIAVCLCLSVCVCLSATSLSSTKMAKIGTRKQLHTIAQGF